VLNATFGAYHQRLTSESHRSAKQGYLLRRIGTVIAGPYKLLAQIGESAKGSPAKKEMTSFPRFPGGFRQKRGIE
jgi:hypothetical protein